MLNKIINFTKLLNKFRSVERVVLVNEKERNENDVEHSYYMAMLAWYIVNVNKLDLDINLVIKYALIHDFVEVYAGDTYIYSSDKAHIESKEKREKEAAEKLQKDFSEFEDMHTLIEKYEKREDKESRFVYALDKIQPMVNIYTDNGRSWKVNKVKLQMLVDHKKDKVVVSPEVKKYFEDLIELLKKEEKDLFNA
ncbi:MAG: metal dependent phosphohydrolase [Parcubacteria group bacterium LiPW_30]|nr:MAG: metal dependent phosphohydrolase [Parcubacteria group bacterium LiPW_30]